VDAEWKGRVNCARCGIRYLMLFSELPETAFSGLLYAIDNLSYEPGTALYEEGRHGNALYSIREGLVKLVSRVDDGDERIVRLLGFGSTIGLELLESGTAYRHSAIALDKLDVCRIPLPTILELESKFPELCRQIRQRLQQELNQADLWISALNTGPARRRLAHLLLIQTDIGADRRGNIQLLRRDDMAAMIGVSMETASRIIAEFKREGLLSKVGPNLFHADTERLTALAGRTPYLGADAVPRHAAPDDDAGNARSTRDQPLPTLD